MLLNECDNIGLKYSSNGFILTATTGQPAADTTERRGRLTTARGGRFAAVDTTVRRGGLAPVDTTVRRGGLAPVDTTVRREGLATVDTTAR
jgi:hypothetical protein